MAVLTVGVLFFPPDSLAATPRFSDPGRDVWRTLPRGASESAWTAVETRTNLATGRLLQRTNAFVQLGAGLNRTNALSGWQPTSAEFVPVSGGAVSTNSVHQVSLPADIGSGTGIAVRKPDGRSILLQPLALDYFDPVDGRSVLLDSVTNAAGWLVASNEVVYSNCFTHIRASIRVRNTMAGIESDLLLHERPPAPGAFGLSDSARLEMLTEQVDGDTPQIQWRVLQWAIDPIAAVTQVEPDLWDASLNFGGMRMPTGRAFSNARLDGTNAVLTRLPVSVGKSYLFIDARRILVEAVPHRLVLDALAMLPEATGLTTNAIGSASGSGQSAFLNRVLPGAQMAAAANPIREIRLRDTALLDPARGLSPVAQASAGLAMGPAAGGFAPVFVLDYQLVGDSGLTNFVFRGDTTYFITDFTDVYGETRIEGGAVLKFVDSAALRFQAGATLVQDTDPYHPAVLTSMEDETVGESIPGNAGFVYQYSCAWPFEFLDGNHELRNLRISHFYMGVHAFTGTITARNVQFVNTMTCFWLEGVGQPLNLYNCLFTDCGWIAAGDSPQLHAEHITVDNCVVLSYAYAPACASASLVNSLLVRQQYPPEYGGTLTTDAVVQLGDNTGVFETVEGGGFYLPAESPYRTGASANIDATLQVDLATRTTYAPSVLTGTVTEDIDLTPTAYADTGSLGYHYPRIDYLTRDLGLVNASVSLKDGVVVAAGFTTNNSLASIWLSPGRFISDGSPAFPNRFVRANQVQERVAQRGEIMLIAGYPDQFRPEIVLRHTAVSSLAGEYYLCFATGDFGRLEACHSTFFNGYLGGSLYAGIQQLVGLTNNLFRSVHAAFWNNSDAPLFAYNNSFHRGSFTLAQPTTQWRIYDNVFDQTDVSATISFLLNNDYGETGFNVFVGQDNVPTVSAPPLFWYHATLPYSSGPLGGYYQPSGSPLVNAGSRNADAVGLSHFTTSASQTKEGSSVVDIGFHYLAVNGAGNPLDTDGDGLADYIEDPNGNGTQDTGETSHLLADTDGDGLTDYQEIVLIGLPYANPLLWDTDGDTISDGNDDADGDMLTNLEELALGTHLLLADTDGDKLTDLQEIELGYDPLDSDTGNSGVIDGDKDLDGDSLSNAAELNIYGSDPGVANSLNAAISDGLFKFVALASLSGPPLTEGSLSLAVVSGGHFHLTLSGVPAGSAYEIYICTGLTGNSIFDGPWSSYLPGIAGQREWDFWGTELPPIAFFMAVAAADTDGDGLSDGYEALVSKTCVDNSDSDGDGSPDGWEVQLGSDPKTKRGPRNIFEDVIAGQGPTRWFKLNNSLADSSGTVNLTDTPTSNNYTNDLFFNINGARWFNGPTHSLLLNESDDPIGGGSSDLLQQGSFSLLFRALSGPASNTRKHYLISQGTPNTGEEIAAYFTTSGDLKLGVGSVEQVILDHYDVSDGVANDVVYGAWYYLAVTCGELRGNNEVHWYLGRVGSQTLRSGSLTLGTLKKFGTDGNITIGNDDLTGTGFDNGYGNPGLGLIDQVAFWRRELMASEIWTQFKAASPDTIPASFLSGTPAFFNWELMLPVTGLHQMEDNNPATPINPTLLPYVITTGWMNSGFKYVDPADTTRRYFYREGNSLVFETPWNGAVNVTADGDSPRSELRSTLADGSQDNWYPSGTHTLEATCIVNEAGTGNNRKIIIGQIHGKSPDKPTFTVNYNFPAAKQVSLTYLIRPDGSTGDNNLILAENVNINDLIHYKVRLTDDGTTVKIHAEAYDVSGVSQTALDQRERPLTPYDSWHAATFYFKAGCYYPNKPFSGTAKVTFSNLSGTHAP